MTKQSIYKSSEGEAEVMSLYFRQLAGLPLKCDHRRIKTRFGLTHVTMAGPEGASPLLVLPGVHAPAPFNLAFWQPLASEYRLYSPDTIGQPGRSVQTRISPGDHHYGKWVVDLLDGLGLDRPAAAGISFGGAVLLDAAADAPERISSAVLVVPGGIAASRTLPLLFRLALPALLYRSFPNRNRLLRVFRPFMTEVDEALLEFLGTYLRRSERSAFGVPLPGPFTKEMLQNFHAPTLVLLAREDLFVPVDQAAARAEEIIPNLFSIEILESRHIPTKKMTEEVNERVRTFLQKVSGRSEAA
ncbi:MAG: alpha/beta hydrolase [Candidatus Manganitrophaceae bacterium]|nr:MAG: alpha/beta hydrolase [Candidatus Manganitrophaceae bacterium]